MKHVCKLFIVSMLLLQVACAPSGSTGNSKSNAIPEPEAISFLGEPLYSPAPDPDLLDQYKRWKVDYRTDTTKLENLIWYGRFAAYTGGYREAIQIYTNGIEKAPADARLYRHRGHRYISVRKLDQAITDLKKAAQLEQDRKNEIEPDGMPNAQNIPLTTLQGNIWYHLGLAYYLKQDHEKALAAYRRCLDLSQNDDNIVSATHWIYMILRRLGRVEEADTFLEQISEDMKIIENFSYHQACLMYKGVYKPEDFKVEKGNTASNDALTYAIGNWYFYNGATEEAKAIFQGLLDRKTGWSSFGYIAAEADWKAFFQEH